MVILPTPADGLKVFDLTPKVFEEVAAWLRTSKARVVSRKVVHGEHPAVLIAYVIERPAASGAGRRR